MDKKLELHCHRKVLRIHVCHFCFVTFSRSQSNFFIEMVAVFPFLNGFLRFVPSFENEALWFLTNLSQKDSFVILTVGENILLLLEACLSTTVVVYLFLQRRH